MIQQDFRLVPGALAALVGAFVGLRTHAPAMVGLLMVTAAVVGAGGLVLLRRAGAVTVFLVVLCGTCGLTVVHDTQAHPPWIRAAYGEHIEVSGSISGRPEKRVTPWGTASCSVAAQVNGAEILLLGDVCEALAGQEVIAEGTLKEPYRQGHDAGQLSATELQLSGEGRASARAVAAIDTALTALLATKPAHASGLIPGVVLGDDSRLTDELRQAMKVTGLTHLVAVSGGHISVLMSVVVLCIGRRRPLLTAIVTALSIAGLVVLVGPEASVLRAVGMSIPMLVALAVGRGSQATPSLSVAVVGMALIDPWVATSYGFLLSASATAGIVWIGGPLRRHLARFTGSTAAELMAIPLAAQLACLPVLALFATQGSVWGVLANVAVAPVVAPLTIFGLLTAVFAPWVPVLAAVAVVPAQMVTWWIDVVARTIALWPGSGIPLGMAALSTLALLVAALLLRRWYLSGLVIVALVALVWWTGRVPAEAVIPPDWEVVQCDVGQGSALLAKVDDAIVMVDVGPVGEAAGKCVREAGVEHIDLLVLSHFHADHVGGLPGVLSAASVGEVWISPNDDPAENSTWVESLLTEEGIPTRVAVAGERFVNANGSPVGEALWPRPDYSGDANNSSVVMSIAVSGGIIVLGDVEQDAQDQLASSVPAAQNLVMAHHGSASQSEKLAGSIAPQRVLISVGENTYGHPAPRALEIYAFADVVDTQSCGTISWGRDREVHSRCAQ